MLQLPDTFTEGELVVLVLVGARWEFDRGTHTPLLHVSSAEQLSLQSLGKPCDEQAMMVVTRIDVAKSLMI